MFDSQTLHQSGSADLFGDSNPKWFANAGIDQGAQRFSAQLLKWVGNKQRQAPDIIQYFPPDYGTYYEPFLGSGGVLGVLAPGKAVASDTFGPLIGIWQALSNDPERLTAAYNKRYDLLANLGKAAAYRQVLGAYNAAPNWEDLLFLSRTCYGGVVRFRKNDGHMSTPVGVHDPISPQSFANRVKLWAKRVEGTKFLHLDFADALCQAKRGDLVYCDPPYVDSQSILYGAQSFSLAKLLKQIALCKSRGVYVALSIDGSKYSGRKLCEVDIPDGLFEREEFVTVGRSMLKRFQMDGRTLERHVVKDRLLLTY